MKHVIVIETADTLPMHAEAQSEFQSDCIKFLDYTVCYHFFGAGNYTIQSRFFEESAVLAVYDMTKNDPSEDTSKARDI